MPPRGMSIDTSVVLNAPLWHPDLSISPFTSKPPNPVVCTVTGGATRTKQGWYLDAVNGKISVAGNIAPVGLTDRTIETWVKPDSVNYGAPGYFISWGDYSDTHHMWSLIAAGNPGIWKIFTASLYYSSTKRVIADWQHLVVTLTAAIRTLKFFVGTPNSPDVQYGGDILLPVDINTSNGTVIIGDRPTLPAGGIGATIDNIKITNGVMSASQGERDRLATKWRYK